jgi:hypothetical protein
VAQLNADLALKLQILFLYSADIPIRHNLYTDTSCLA